MTGWPGGRRARIALLLVCSAVAACREPDLSLPTDTQVAEYFAPTRIVSAEMKGNVAEVTVAQSADQLARGGRLWAQVGPYIYLLSEPTLELFRDFGGLAGVRVITTTGSQEVARALLPRAALNELTWRRALNIAGRARLEGTEHLRRLEDLIRFGEDHTEFTYQERYVRRR